MEKAEKYKLGTEFKELRSDEKSERKQMFDYNYIYIKERNWIGHILGGDGLLRDVMDERMMGEAKRQAKSWDDG